MTAFYKTKAGNNQLGDTIVEVLLAIAVVGIVLTATFVSANRSLRGIQLSKDRSEALTLAKSAVTEIKKIYRSRYRLCRQEVTDVSLVILLLLPRRHVQT